MFCCKPRRTSIRHTFLCARQTINTSAWIDFPCKLFFISMPSISLWVIRKLFIEIWNLWFVFQSLIAAAMVLYGTIDSLIDFFSFTAWIFYGGSMLALIVMRYTKPNHPRPYKVRIMIAINNNILILLMHLIPEIFSF